MQTDLDKELARRAKAGYLPVTVAEMDRRLRSIGYRLDRSRDCVSVNRHMTGEYAGESYPAVNTGVSEVDTGMSFSHYQARRDDNFNELQALRFNGELFAVLPRGAILEI